MATITITIRKGFFPEGLPAERLATILTENAPKIARAIAAAEARGLTTSDGLLRTERPRQFQCGSWVWEA